MRAKRGVNGSGQLLNFSEDSYLEQTSRPFCAIIFLLPFIIFYELGTIFINTDVLNQSQVRVVAFVWLQNFLEGLGFGSKTAWIAPPVAVVAILLAQQVVSRKRWRFRAGVVVPMAIECVMLAVPLIVLSLFLNTSVPVEGDVADLGGDFTYVSNRGVYECSAIGAESSGGGEDAEADTGGGYLLADIVTGIGAGIYEELVFRLILICVFMLIFQDLLRLSRANSMVLSVLISAALFSAHHHVFFVDGEFSLSMPFTWTQFGFRTIAGVYFAVLFAIRGFGVAAGTHAFYDTIAVLMNAIFFHE